MTIVGDDDVLTVLNVLDPPKHDCFRFTILACSYYRNVSKHDNYVEHKLDSFESRKVTSAELFVVDS
ncbi:hypothetical protein Tco_0211920 [Tanacetum coccineum]